jgi:hypothetical protein
MIGFGAGGAVRVTVGVGDGLAEVGRELGLGLGVALGLADVAIADGIGVVVDAVDGPPAAGADGAQPLMIKVRASAEHPPASRPARVGNVLICGLTTPVSLERRTTENDFAA